ncbi:tripartite tricarboxylate transporter substrate binding protein [Roseomonas terrae]|uniref:Tripartite tricarboxylate transporter substrate binding protein n=1 Tax=Neoroseomonas terrae TaxID=424799 RepID=A0ABS5EQ71_9PROT|nr:tripartite tricarboxylate transporter substrate binding protein [Neoroseomonas terrae]MBR0653193.1 tripartite tricarboxylate transporter substrate binding protein [Neoroseomonas terrae]
MTLERRTMLGGLLVAASGASSAPAQSSGLEAWPTRPVEIVVPYAAGGPADRYARAFGVRLAEVWRQPVVIVARPGGAAAIGAAAVANAPPDGHSLLLGSTGMVTNQLLLRNMPYTPAALSPLALVAFGGGIFFVHPSVPARTAKELQDYGKANPGALKFGSSGIGATPHLAAELFAMRAGIEITHIPYRGTAPALTDLLAGHINAMYDSATSIRHVQEGKIRAIASSGPIRNRVTPDVPTMIESGFDVEIRTFYSFFSPTAAPVALRRKIEADFLAVASSGEIQEMFLQDGLDPEAMTSDAFGRFLTVELTKWSEVFRAANIAAQ